jgi:hypothetical protein
MRRALLILVSLLVATIALGTDCGPTTPRFELNPANQNPTITFPKDTTPATIVKDAAVTLVIGGGAPIAATVTDVTQNAFIGGAIVTLHTNQPLNGPITGRDASGLTSATVTLKPPTGNAIDLCGLTPMNYSFHVGPAVSTSGSGTGNPAGLIRFQYSRGVLRLVQISSDAALIPAARNLQEELSVSIDTTDRKVTGTQFVDDNRLIGAIRSPEKSLGILFNRVRVGLEGQFAKAIHTDDRNIDVTVVVDGWLPIFQAVNILSQTRTRTLPLSFRLSGGRRSQNVSGVKSNGNLADGALTYHFYLLERYAVALSAKTVFNDVSNRPASTPRTQHSYTAAISYKPDPLSKFSAVASYESGHSGPVFTKLRQYFVGIGIAQLFGQSPKP